MPEPRIQESRRTPLNGDRDTAGSAGGQIVTFKAQAAGLKIGDVVSVSTTVNDSVQKTAVAADGAKLAGVVVGGGSVGGYDPSFFGSTAVGNAVQPGTGQGAAIGSSVNVQIDGIAWVVAGAAIALGATVGLDTTTAGRVLTNAVAGQIIGIALRAAAGAASVIPILIVRR